MLDTIVNNSREYDYFKLAQDRIRGINDETTRKIYYNALRYSACIEDEIANFQFETNHEAPIPTDVARLCAASLDQIDKLHMCLTRKKALEYLNYKGILLTERQLEFKTKKTVFRLQFGREPVTLESGKYIFTYGELYVLCASDFTIRWN
jgi:hypothetical protein